MRAQALSACHRSAQARSRRRARNPLWSFAGVGVLLLAVERGSSARADHIAGNERSEDTAYTLPAGTFSVGLLTAEAGLFDEITVGTYLPAWFAFPVVDSPILTGFVKLRAPFEGPVALSMRVGAAYFNAGTLAADLSGGRATRSDVLAVPFELAASIRIGDFITQSFELSYVSLDITASEDNATTGGGSATTSTASLSALFQLRLTRRTALTMAGRVLLSQSAARISAHLTRGPTSLKAQLGFRPYDGSVLWSLVPGVAFSWAHVNLELGIGYGSYWLPIIQAPLPGVSIVPEGNMYVRF
jgi:hypothetical protein